MSEIVRRFELHFTLPSGEVLKRSFTTGTVTVGFATGVDLSLATIFPDLNSITGYMQFSCTMDGTELQNDLNCELTSSNQQLLPQHSSKLKHGDVIHIGSSLCRIQFKYVRSDSQAIDSEPEITNELSAVTNHSNTRDADLSNADHTESSIANDTVGLNGDASTDHGVPSTLNPETAKRVNLKYLVLGSILLICVSLWLSIGNKKVSAEIQLSVSTGETIVLEFQEMAYAHEIASPSEEFEFTLSADSPSSVSVAMDGKSAIWTPQIGDPTEKGKFTLVMQNKMDSADIRTLRISYSVIVLDLPPIVESIPDQRILLSEVGPLKLAIKAFDPNLENGELKHSIIGSLPEGAVFDVDTGEFSWTPVDTDFEALISVRVRTFKKNDPLLSTDTEFQIELIDDVSNPEGREQVLQALHVVWATAPEMDAQPVAVATSIAISPTILLSNVEIIKALVELKEKGWAIGYSRLDSESPIEVSNLFIHSWYRDLEQSEARSEFELFCNVGLIEIPNMTESFARLASPEEISAIEKDSRGVFLYSNINERQRTGNVSAEIKLNAVTVSDTDLRPIEIDDQSTNIGLIQVTANIGSQNYGAPLVLNDNVVALYSASDTVKSKVNDKAANLESPVKHLFTTVGMVHHFFEPANRSLWISVLPKD